MQLFVSLTIKGEGSVWRQLAGLVVTSLLAWAWILAATLLILLLERRLGGVLELETGMETRGEHHKQQ